VRLDDEPECTELPQGHSSIRKIGERLLPLLGEESLSFLCEMLAFALHSFSYYEVLNEQKKLPVHRTALLSIEKMRLFYIRSIRKNTARGVIPTRPGSKLCIKTIFAHK